MGSWPGRGSGSQGVGESGGSGEGAGFSWIVWYSVEQLVTSRGRYIFGVAGPRFVVSILLGAGFYLGWMGLFLVSRSFHTPLLRGLLWIIAPVVTAFGFYVGAVLFARLGGSGRLRVRRVYLYPLVGCSVGAAVVFPFGAMLIVFGMCLGGSLGMLVFEIVGFRGFAAGREE